APEVEIAAELAQLAGGAHVLAARAQALLAEGNPRLAAHLAEWAVQAAPQDRETARVRAEVYNHRAAQETSTMAKGMFTWAATESRAAAEGREMFAMLSD
ncbi:MAG TPA: alkyl sulfatase dimerization domain-containing protein, partial [Actinocrinis sp.]|uniref:alkyl sulfatase dimerization domain-containing protein n=1 Tax=Actinocrinis sp. TaxID=1920516 RepID=UPI002DDCAF40